MVLFSIMLGTSCSKLDDCVLMTSFEPDEMRAPNYAEVTDLGVARSLKNLTRNSNIAVGT